MIIIALNGMPYNQKWKSQLKTKDNIYTWKNNSWKLFEPIFFNPTQFPE